MNNQFTIGRLAKTWPTWKIKLVDFILYSIPILKIRFTNKLVNKFKDYKNEVFAKVVCKELGITTEVHGLEHLVKDGPVTIACNHPGGGDIMAVAITIGQIRNDFVIPANELVCIEQIQEITIPVKISGNIKMDKTLLHKAYQEGKAVVFFAGGKNSRYTSDGLLRDRRWRTTFLEFAEEYNTPIQVMRIDGKNSSLFYKVADIRKRYKFLKNVPLENIFQLRELTRSSHMKLYLSNAFYYTKPNQTKAEKRKKTDALYNFLYEMNENNLRFEPNLIQPN